MKEMEEQTKRQMQGAVELLRDVVQAGAGSIGAAHQEIAEVPYRVLSHIPGISRPAGAIGNIQREVTQLAYATVGAIAGAVAAATTHLLQAMVAEQPASAAPYSSTTLPVRADS